MPPECVIYILYGDLLLWLTTNEWPSRTEQWSITRKGIEGNPRQGDKCATPNNNRLIETVVLGTDCGKTARTLLDDKGVVLKRQGRCLQELSTRQISCRIQGRITFRLLVIFDTKVGDPKAPSLPVSAPLHQPSEQIFDHSSMPFIHATPTYRLHHHTTSQRPIISENTTTWPFLSFHANLKYPLLFPRNKACKSLITFIVAKLFERTRASGMSLLNGFLPTQDSYISHIQLRVYLNDLASRRLCDKYTLSKSLPNIACLRL